MNRVARGAAGKNFKNLDMHESRGSRNSACPSPRSSRSAFRAGGVRIGAKRQTITRHRAPDDNNTRVRQVSAFGMGCAQLPNVCSFWRACSASSVRGYSVRIFCSTNFASVVSPVAAKASANISRAAGALSPLR